MSCRVLVNEEEKKDLNFLLFHLVFDEQKGKRFTATELHKKLNDRYSTDFKLYEIERLFTKWDNLGWLRANAFDYQVVRRD